MLQVKMQSKVAENPFYGKSAMKQLLNQGKTCSSKSSMDVMLDSAWKEAKDSKDLREGFFIICFSIGEITNRQHNIFGKQKVDNGGNAARPQFMWIMSWLRKNNPTQYYKFMFARIINEFVSFFVILACQIRTMKGKKSINPLDTQTYSALAEHDLDKVAEFLAGIILKGSIIDKIMLAKWLVIPRFSKRQKVNREKAKEGQRDLQPETKILMLYKSDLLSRLSSIVKWEVIEHPNNKQFKGLIEWKKQYNQTLESVLFSTKQICTLDKEQFFNLLNNCPSGARYRIQRRLLDKDGNSKKKWSSNIASYYVSGTNDLAGWFKEWEKFKETKQQEERILVEKVRQGDVSEDTKVKLEKVKKEAKVNVGASSLKDELERLLAGKADNTLIHSIMNRVQFRVPVFFWVDRSGSMSGRSTQIAKLLTTIGMLKNPSQELDNVFGTFGSDATIHTDLSKTKVTPNRFITSGRTIVVDKLIDRTKDFQWNFSNLSQFIHCNDGSTNVHSIGKRLAEWMESDSLLKQHRMEQLQSYPVMILISDNAFNNGQCPKSSLVKLQTLLAHYGWNGVIVIWDTAVNSDREKSDPFEGLLNVFHYYGWNIGAIDQIFSNIHDLDVLDVYTELKSLWISNRYTAIKAVVD